MGGIFHTQPDVIDYSRFLKDTSSALLERSASPAHLSADTHDNGRHSRSSSQNKASDTTEVPVEESDNEEDSTKAATVAAAAGATTTTTSTAITTTATTPSDHTLTQLLDQKLFLEESIRNLESQLASTAKKLETTQIEKSELVLQLQSVSKSSSSTRLELEKVQKELQNLKETFKRQDEV